MIFPEPEHHFPSFLLLAQTLPWSIPLVPPVLLSRPLLPSRVSHLLPDSVDSVDLDSVKKDLRRPGMTDSTAWKLKNVLICTLFD